MIQVRIIMPLNINTNSNSLTTQLNLSRSQQTVATSVNRLSSGLRVNGASDDAAGLSIAVGMKSDISAMQVAARNANDGISLFQTAEGAAKEISNILQRLKDLTVQAASDTYETAQRTAIGAEATQLVAEIDRIVTTTTFNGKELIDGSGSATFSLQVDVGSALTFDLSAIDMATDADGLGLDSLDFTSATAAATSLTAIETAIVSVSTDMSTFGALQNRLESAINNLNNKGNNISQALGRIQDADFAVETANLSKGQVLQQAGMSMLAQAHQMPQNVLSLLQ